MATTAKLYEWDHFTDSEHRFGVAVAESRAKRLLQTLTDQFHEIRQSDFYFWSRFDQSGYDSIISPTTLYNSGVLPLVHIVFLIKSNVCFQLWGWQFCLLYTQMGKLRHPPVLFDLYIFFCMTLTFEILNVSQFPTFIDPNVIMWLKYTRRFPGPEVQLLLY